MSRPNAVRTLGAMAALLASGLAVGGSVAPQDFRAPTTRTAPTPVREFVGEKKRRLPGKKKRSAIGRRDPLASYPWQYRKDGSAIDGRGDYRSPKRLARQRLCAKYGVTSGRQWVRLRKALRAGAPVGADRTTVPQ